MVGKLKQLAEKTLKRAASGAAQPPAEMEEEVQGLAPLQAV